MTATQRILGRARGRMLAGYFLHALGWSLLAGALLCAAGLVTSQVLGYALPWVTVLFPAVAGFAVLVAGVVALARWPGDAAVAVTLDERLKLKDRLGTSLYAATLERSTLTDAVIEDAEKSVAGLRVSHALPLWPLPGWGNRAWGGALLAAALLAVLTFDPAGLYARALDRKAQRQAEAERAAQIEEALAEAKKDAQAIPEDPQERKDDAAALDAMDPAELDEKLQAMLSQRDLTRPQDRRDAAAEVSDLQEKFAEAVAQKEQAQRAMQNMMSQLDPAETGPADDFADALRRNDFEAAQQELAKLADQLESGDLAENQKQHLAQQMDQLAQQLQQMAEQQQQLAEQSQQQIQQAMREAGMTQEQIEQAMEKGLDSPEMQQALQQAMEKMKGMSSEQAQQMAQQMQQQMRQMQQQAQEGGQAGEQARQMAQRMEQMGKALREQSQQNQQLSEAMRQLQEKLGQCAGDQQSLQNAQSANDKLKQAMEKLAGNGQGNQPGSSGSSQQAQQGGQGPGEGRGSGGNPLGEEKPALGTASHAQADIQDGQGGRVIASWTRDGQMSKGDAKLTFNRAVTEAKADAERAVSEDRTPARYHQAIRDYFGNLPEAPPSE